MAIDLAPASFLLQSRNRKIRNSLHSHWTNNNIYWVWPRAMLNIPPHCHNIIWIDLKHLETKRVKARIAPLAITLSDPHGGFALPIPIILGFARLEVLVSREDTFLSEDTSCIPLYYKLWFTPEHFGRLVSKDQPVRRGVIIVAGVIVLGNFGRGGRATLTQ